MSSLCDGIPNEDIAVKAVHRPAVFAGCLGYPVIIVSGPHLVWVAVLEHPADAVDEDGGVFLEDLILPLLSSEDIPELLAVSPFSLTTIGYILAFQLYHQGCYVEQSSKEVHGRF